MSTDFTSLNSNQLNNLITSSNFTECNKSYSAEEYADALCRIQSLTYKDPRLVWGIRWKQKLANCLPFIIKLLYKGYNNFLVFPISSYQHKWFSYSEESALKYLKSAGLASTCLAGLYWKNSNHLESHVDVFHKEFHEDNHSIITRQIEELSKVGAIAKVKDSLVDLNSNYKYASKYIISKDKLRELVSLTTNTYYSITHTTLSYSSITTSTSNTTNNNHFLHKGARTCENNGKCIKKYTVSDLIEWNNKQLPEEEQMTYNGRRIYSEVCGYVNEDKHDIIEPGIMTKQRYLDKVFGQNNWFEFDRRGSIYNLTYSLNNKAYLDNNVDIYEKINNKVFADKKERDLYKATQMSIYFSTGRRLVNFIIRNLNNKYNGNVIPKQKNDLIQAFWKLCNCDENTDWNEFVTRLYKHFNLRKKQMTKFIGDNKWLIDRGSKYNKSTYVKNEDCFIFMHESEVYLRFVTKLREKGLKVVQIYDGFYLEKGSISEEELNTLLKSVILSYTANKGC